MSSLRPRLQQLLSPRAVAVTGASEKSGQAATILRNLHIGERPPQVFVVNPNRSEVLGHPCYPSIAALPAPVDVLIVMVPTGLVLPAVQEAAAAGIPFVQIFTSGFAEQAQGRDRFRALRELAGRVGILGPASFGVLTPEANLYFGESAGKLPAAQAEPGVALFAQSGGLLNALVMEAPGRGLNVRYAFATGQEVDLGIPDFLAAVVADPAVRAAGIIVEEIKRPEVFSAALQAARQRRLPVVVLKAGKSPRSHALTLAHSGSLAGDAAFYEAYFRKAGAVMVDNLEQMMSDLIVFSKTPPPQGRGVGVVTISGGECTILPDLAEKWGLDLPHFAPETAAGLDAVFQDELPRLNPLDASYLPLRSQAAYEQMLTSVGSDPGVHVLMTRLFRPKERHEAIMAAAAATGRSVVVFTRLAEAVADADIVTRLPLVREIESALIAVRHLVDYYCPPTGAPADARPAPGTDGPSASGSGSSVGRVLRHSEVHELLAPFRLPFVPEARVETLAQALDFAAAVGFPVVMKLLHPGIVHKTERKLVHLNLRDTAAVGTALGRLQELAASLDGGGEIWVSQMVTGGIEAYVGMHRDPRFGAGILLGLGGVWVELLRSTQLLLPPVTEADFNQALARTLLPKLLAGFRTEQRFDRAALWRFIQAFSDFLASAGRPLAAIDINPLFVLPEGQGVLMADCKVIARND